jgi:ribosomal protein S27AE
MEKICFKCKFCKPLIEFYKHSEMGDGHLNKCKECTKKDVNKHRSENLEKVREYDRNRANNPDRRKANIAINKAWRQEDKRRVKCHNIVSRAIKSGKLVRKNCKRCGNENSLAHHEDYDKPLDVIWLCQPCHKQRHKEINFILTKGF